MIRFRFLLLIFCAFPLFSWETAIAGVLTTPPAQGMNGRVYSTADDKALHCLDSVSGREYWSFRPGRKLKDFTVVSPDGSILIMTVQNHMVSVSPGGRELWRIMWNSEIQLPPAVDPHGNIYLLTTGNALHCIDRLGTICWTVNLQEHVLEYFAVEKGILLFHSNGTEIIYADGRHGESLQERPASLVFRAPDLFWKNYDGRWYVMNRDDWTLIASESPLTNEILYPDSGILITRNGQIVSGRKDWFMEAMESGEESYDPYYQPGNNPGRSRGIDQRPGEQFRFELFKGKGGSPFDPLLLLDESLRDGVLGDYEKMNSFQELIIKNPDYDLDLYQLLEDDNVVSFDVNRERMDVYSRSRIYGILTRWGDIKSRETLLYLSTVEKEPYNLNLIMDGLGKIGLDEDGRSMLAINKIVRAFPRESRLLSAAVRNSAAVARYNGNRSIAEMMLLFERIQSDSRDPSVLAEIKKQLDSF